MSAESASSGDAPVLFTDLALPAPLLRALADVGYETPSPIQAATIPPLLAGRDVIGQAQTGTGKTAAFALPLLARIDASPAGKPQALVLAPTRELAIQVAEAFQKYATYLPGFHVLPIYGGQGYGAQLHALRRGVHVIVGTPGRVIDHLKRGTLDLSELRCIVLDEADEMLRMGFIDDVEEVMKATPETRQVALFSATMPPPIRRIAQTYLKDPVEVAIKATTTTAASVKQRMVMVSGHHKLDAITRVLEAEPFDAMIVFARTKVATEELSEKLAARGIAVAALHGDVPQIQREKTIAQLKDGRIDVLVATDVAARGLDVDRISHVLNYDIPYDTESYVHRIGRTGRAGRTGEAILFVTPRERGMLRAIERATRQPIEAMDLPSVADVNARRVDRFLGRISEALESPALPTYRELIERFEREHNVPAVEIAAALAHLTQGDAPLLMDAAHDPLRESTRQGREERAARPPRPFDDRAREPRGERPVRSEHPRAERAPRNDAERGFDAERPRRGAPDAGMETFRIEVGHQHGVKPGNIVGAIANEADLESRYIGRIEIRDAFTLIDLPEGMPPEVMDHLRRVRVAGQQLRISRDTGAPARSSDRPRPRGPGGPRPGGPRGPRPPRRDA